MNVISRGIKNALRSPLRSGLIALMLAISIGLILSMLVARSSVDAKIDEVKSNAGTQVTIAPAGIRGFQGGGDPLTSDQLSTITATEHIASVTSSLSDQLGTDDTNLVASLELGSFGARQQRFDSDTVNSNTNSSFSEDENSTRPTPTPRTTVTGTSDINSVATDGGSLNISDGESIDGTTDSLVALVGTDLATKNSLSVGSTFTAYDETLTVKGIFDTGNAFQDSGLIIPLKTLQNITDQAGAVTSVVAKVDSSDNVEAVVASLESSLADAVDVTSEAEQAANSVASLQSISSLALAGVIGASIAGAVIILLAMVIIVRERRREIGVIKAIGGSNFKVITQFVTEALTLTIIGGVLGLTFGVLVSGPMTTSLVSNQDSSSTEQAAGQGPGFMRMDINQLGINITQVTSSLTPQAFTTSVGITLLISVIGSAVPAWFISRIRPAEVLRTE